MEQPVDMLIVFDVVGSLFSLDRVRKSIKAQVRLRRQS